MKDYFVYLPEQKTDSIWGCLATSVGYAVTPPGAEYPPHRHPMDHHLKWSEGRVLQRYQIILISEGAGVFECESLPGSQPVKPGSVLLVFPGIWHRYRPSANTGWAEHWIECKGRVFDEAMRAGLIEPSHSVLKVGPYPDMLDCFKRCHSLAQSGALANQVLLSTLGMHILALLGCLGGSGRGGAKTIEGFVERAQELITLRCHEPLKLRALASELGVGYSHLRQSFKAGVGLSLRQHYLNVRLQKAQDLLMNTSKPVKDIAAVLGFQSIYHLSHLFKSKVGMSPTQWRAKASKRTRRFAAARPLRREQC